MKLSVSAYRAHASAHKKILSSSYHSTPHYGSTAAAGTSSAPGLYAMEPTDSMQHGNTSKFDINSDCLTSPTGTLNSGNEATTTFSGMHRDEDEDSSNAPSVSSKSPSQRKPIIGDGNGDPDSDWNKSNQRWMKLRTTVQISSAIQKKPPLKREDSFLKRFSTRQIPDTQETVEDTGSESASGDVDKVAKRRRRYLQKRRSVVNPDENFYFYWLMALCTCVLYNLWTLIVRQSFPELQKAVPRFWILCDAVTDVVFVVDVIVQLRTGYLEQGLMVYDDKKLACHYMQSTDFFFDIAALVPLDLLQFVLGTQPLLRFPRFLKVYRSVKFYYIVESRTVWPNLWRVVNLIHILLILAHWFGCFYYLLSEAEGFQGDWVYPYRPGDYATLTRKYLGSLYWSTLTLTTIGDLPTPETNAEPSNSADGPRSLPRRGIKSRLLQFGSNYGYVFTIVSYLIGVFIFATIVGQVGNVITNRNANRLEFERLLDGAKTYMRHHKVPGGMKRRVLRWYDYSWSRGRIQGGGDINTALGLLPDKLKTELALHVNLSVLKKVTIFQECQPEFLHDLVLKMKAYIFTPGDSICRKGEVAREMFIIADGILEVLSETGKVLTTMKAGDFFGEIGILNLDGLNKRTADVRSVGYSELFSLSREDVLAAMKDYPDAQEILQTLGRKRLMEVRCVNKRHAKAASDKEAHRLQQLQQQQQQQQHSNIHQSDNSSENSTSKKITDKLKVRGIRGVLKKSRAAARRNNEALEMKPLHSSSPKNPKYLLKRMSRVKSDEDKADTEEIIELKVKTASPIGAGLPLLHRLRLLKEKQDREERAVKPTPSQKSPPHSHVTSTLSPQESIQEEPERETNEGLPLIQRLQQLKINNEMSPSEQIPMIMTTLTSPTSTISRPTKNRLSITSSVIDTSTSESQSSKIPSLPLTQFKPTLKVSFRERIQALQSGASSSSADKTNAKIESSIVTTADIESNARAKVIPTISNKITKPSSTITKSLSELKKPQSTMSLISTDSSIKPWSKLKLATLISSNSYTSLTNCSGDELITPIRIGSDSNLSISTFDNSERQLHLPTMTATPSFSTAASVPLSSSTMREKPKFYQSVFDLSPEYSGLPFVKRLKILNERQRLAELESVVQTRSLSLDCSKTGFIMPGQSVTTTQLYRSHSEASGIYSQFITTPDGISSSTATSSGASDASQYRLSQCLQEYSPLSPESNETPERRQLKSILKKLHRSKDDNSACTSTDAADGTTDKLQDHQNGLMKAPTLEGYVARHSKLQKSVTFNSTLSSPPNSANESINIAGRSDAISKRPDHFQFLPSDIKNYAHLSPCTPTTTPVHHQIDLLTSATNQTDQFYVENQLNLSRSVSSSSNVGVVGDATTFGASSGVIKKESRPLPNRYDGNGLAAPEEYFNQILLGINNVISSNMHEMHKKFENQFSIMETEVRRRDAIIAELQSKISNMETKPMLDVIGVSKTHQHGAEQLSDVDDDDEDDYDEDEDAHHLQGNNSSESSGELLFLRGDSLDTVLSSSPPLFGEQSSAAPSQSTTRRSSADQNQQHNTNPFVHGNGRRYSSQRPWSDNNSQSNLMLSNLTGNLTKVSDDVVLDMGHSSSSSTSSSKSNLEDDDILTEQTEPVHSNDWEVRMLAAELDKRERKRGASLSDNIGDLKKCFRRRRKHSDTETECSESDTIEAPTQSRPRAGSLDQFNMQHGTPKKIFKAMSIDRNKDKL